MCINPRIILYIFWIKRLNQLGQVLFTMNLSDSQLFMVCGPLLETFNTYAFAQQ